MRKWFKKLLSCWEVKQDVRDSKSNLRQNPHLKVVYKKDTSLVLGCFSVLTKGKKKVLNWKGNELVIENKPFQIRKELSRIEKEAKKANKSVTKYLDDTIKLRKASKFVSEYLQLRKKYLALSKRQLYALWDDTNIVSREVLSEKELFNLYFKYFNKYLRRSKKGNKLKSRLEGRNFAEFEIKRFDDNGKLVERTLELSHSGPDRIDTDFLDVVTDSKFLRNVEDFEGVRRGLDSEVRFIYNFIQEHLPKKGTFEITTKNIFIACDSCKRELLMLQELIKDRGTIKVVSVDTIKGTRDLKNYLRIK
ncbi:hypothetical protein [uncultured Aquimarina sp.]|uniref:hypothetical protein n=1 Tax=uncultured Aquimarina sp. TaxID=575652 RepID=UPI002631FE3C|nr:hypothetical protein [uncultured Aquimarina sp.]